MLEAASVLKERLKSLALTLKKDAYQDQKIFPSNIVWTLKQILLKENRPTSNETNKDIGKFSYIDKINTKNKYKVSENFDWVKKKEQIDKNIKNYSFTLVDARSRERFEGKIEEPRPGLIKGCLPGSKNIPYQNCIDSETNIFKTKSELVKIFKENDVDYSKPNVFMCGSGVTACVLGLAYFLISDKNAVIYDGSFAEWGKK